MLTRQIPSSFRIVAAVLLLPAALLAATASGKVETVSWTPKEIQAGSPCLFQVEMSGATALRGKWQGKEITFVSPGKRDTWYGLAGVDVEAKPGIYTLALDAALTNGNLLHEERSIVVARAPYKTEVLHVPDKYVQPDPETLQRIEAEREIKKKAFAHDLPDPEWSGKFSPPVDTAMSEGFGTRRTFNGKLASVHRGLDYHAKPGTPILAANSGQVVLARELFYEGNCVIVDHGQHFMTLYMHMSKLDVTEGEQVRKGQELGLSGATGRATGPHLHIAVRWQDAYLDPAKLWLLPLPQLDMPSGRSANQR